MTSMSAIARCGVDSGAALPPEASKAPEVDMSRGYPVGNGSLARDVRGTVPQADRDLQFALMANDAYKSKGAGPTGTESERELAAAGWKRLTPVGDHMVDARGHRIPINPALLHGRDSGYDAAIYQNDQGQYVLAYRGTDSWSLGAGGDAGTNAAQAIGLLDDQYQQAVELAERAKKVFGQGNIAMTGHSLGGGLASAAMLATGAPGATFNSAGLSDDTLRSLGYDNPNAIRAELANSGQIRRYNVQGEVLTNLQQGTPLADAVGHEWRLAKPGRATDNPITLHGGGRDKASYVEAMRQFKVREPGGLPLMARTHEIVGEYKLKVATAAGRQAAGWLSDLGKVGGQAIQQIGDDFGEGARNGRVLEGTGRATGAAANGVVDAGARAVERAAYLTGDVAREGGTLAGSVLREAGKRTGLPLADLAEQVESGGNTVNVWVDKAGAAAGGFVDQGGDALQRALEAAGTRAEAALDKAIDAAAWAGEKTAEGIEWAGHQTVEGAQWVGKKAQAGAQWLAEKAEAGAQWAGDKVEAGKQWLSDRAGDVGRFLGGALSR